MRIAFTILLIGSLAGFEIQEDKPVATKPATGAITGRITPANKVAQIYAISRVTGKRYSPTRFDRKSGKFRFDNLPGDASYDIAIITDKGERIEGIDLSWFEARLIRLAKIRRKQLGLPPEPKRNFTRTDADELLRYVKDLKDFMDTRRVIYLKSDGRRATMLVEVMRTKPFHSRKGDEIIWRMELWYFRFRYGGWERVANVHRVLERQRISRSRWQKITLVYYPELSVYVDQNGNSKTVNFIIHDRFDPARGRIAETAPLQKAEPIIIGLAQPETTTHPTKSSKPRTSTTPPPIQLCR